MKELLYDGYDKVKHLGVTVKKLNATQFMVFLEDIFFNIFTVDSNKPIDDTTDEDIKEDNKLFVIANVAIVVVMVLAVMICKGITRNRISY